MKIYSIILSISLFLFISNADADYIVKKGDTLYQISKKFNVSVSEIKRANNLKSNRLVAGMRLEINKGKEGQSKTNKKITTKKPLSQEEPKTYVVKKGDNIWRIAKRFNISVDDLKEINELQDNSIKVGQKLYISKSVDKSTEEEIIRVIQANYERRGDIPQPDNKEHMSKEAKTEDISLMSIKDRLILFAKRMLDIPYKFGGNSFMGIDCSAYVQKVYSIAGIELPRTAREQFKEGIPVDKEELRVGDLVFFRTYASFPSHVGIYLGNNLFIHASSKSKKVTIDSLDTPYYAKRFIGAKRLFESEDIDMMNLQ
jgi:cell wall-associated NlpC family hydrolase